LGGREAEVGSHKKKGEEWQEAQKPPKPKLAYMRKTKIGISGQ